MRNLEDLSGHQATSVELRPISTILAPRPLCVLAALRETKVNLKRPPHRLLEHGGAALCWMAHVLAFEAEFLYEEPLGFTANRVDDFRSQRVDHGVVHRGESLDLSHARAANRIRATLVMRMERHRIPDKEPREVRPQDPPEDFCAVLRHQIGTA